MPLPALAALFARVLPAMVGEGEILSGLMTRGTAAGSRTAVAETAGGATKPAAENGAKGLKSMLADLFTNGIAGGSKPRREADDDDERARRRTHMPAAADLFDYRPTRAAADPSMPIPLAKTSVTAGGAQPGGSPGLPPMGGNTFVPANATPRQQPAQQPVSMLKQFGGLITKSLGPLGSQLKFWTKLNLGLYAGAKALETFVWGVSEGNRGLAKWNGQIAASFAKLDIANMQRDIDAAHANAGSATYLNSAFNELMNEMQPFRKDIGTALNIAGIVSANVAKGIAIITKWHPVLMATHALADQLREWLNSGKAVDDPMRDTLKAFVGGMGGRPGPPAPLAPIGPRDPLPPLR